LASGSYKEKVIIWTVKNYEPLREIDIGIVAKNAISWNLKN
jgi:hypothetical protein